MKLLKSLGVFTAFVMVDCLMYCGFAFANKSFDAFNAWDEFARVVYALFATTFLIAGIVVSIATYKLKE
jgi:hypothetical protein